MLLLIGSTVPRAVVPSRKLALFPVAPEVTKSP